MLTHSHRQQQLHGKNTLLIKLLLMSLPKKVINSFSNDVYDGSNEFDNEVESDDEEEHIYRKLEDMHSEDKYREFYFHQHVSSSIELHSYMGIRVA